MMTIGASLVVIAGRAIVHGRRRAPLAPMRAEAASRSEEAPSRYSSIHAAESSTLRVTPRRPEGAAAASSSPGGACRRCGAPRPRETDGWAFALRRRRHGLGEDPDVRRSRAASRLRSCERSSDATDREHPVHEPLRQALQRPSPQHGAERRRRGEVEAQLDARVRRVHRLPARPRRAAEPPPQLTLGDHHRAGHTERAGHGPSMRASGKSIWKVTRTPIDGL